MKIVNNWKQAFSQVVAEKVDRDIVVIGKGPSVDMINTGLLKDYIVINVNDSERICPGDIAVFHHGWVLDFLEDSGPNCKLYVTDRNLPEDVPSVTAEYVPYGPDSMDFMMTRFFSDELYIEHAIMVSALKIAHELGKLSGKNNRVFLLGFDFTTKDGWARAIGVPHGQDEPELLEQLVSAQEKIFHKILLERQRLAVDVVHVGNKPYSFYSIEAFNDLLQTKIVGFDSPKPTFYEQEDTAYQVKIVAEITTNHFGDMERLKSMILAAKRAGADYIKLQKRDVDTFYSADELAKPYTSPFGNTFRDYRIGLELTRTQFEEVDALCKKIGIGWFASVLDYSSYKFMLEFEPELIKLPSTISEHHDYLAAVGAEFTGNIVISTGFTDKAYERFVLDNFKVAGKIYLLQCTSAYPSRKEEVQIGVVRHYYNLNKEDERIMPGFSSHDIGSLCSQMAVAAGALMIEKHVKYGSVAWAHFDEVAVDLVTGDFESFVQDVRLAERIVDSEQKKIRSSEHHKYFQRN